ncbi:RNA-directed DNA polymerase, eukaryota, reverse transcriptase zinc-binding domain protein [Tanacetum coccineum]
MSSNNEYDGIRVDKDDEVEEIWENSNVMDGEGIECGKKVDHECVDVSDSMMKNVTEEIKKLSKEKNKGVFGWADKEIEECNVTFGSMSKNDVEKELELKQKSRSADNTIIPTSMKDNGDEAIIFDEEIVEEGNKKWVNTVCGYFVGCNMSLAELRYSIRRMWNSRLGKPLVMDEVTANMRHNGTRRSAYARVLVEIEASKGFKDIIEIQYKDKNNSMIKTKFVKVEYSWRPISCSHCNVFGHSELRCLKSGIKKDQMENNKGIKVNHDSEGFVEVRSRKYGYTRAGTGIGVLMLSIVLIVVEFSLDGILVIFIYASNSGRERQELWIDLQAHKDFGHQRPWVLMGDFNVTLKTNEHSTGGSYMSGDMIDFNECVNNLELEDICSSGF